MVNKTIKKTSNIYNGDVFDKVDNPYCTTTLPFYIRSGFYVVESLSESKHTPPVAEIFCVKNGRAIVVCGFLVK